MSISNRPNVSPMIVAIYGGIGKPKCEEFLEQFVTELRMLITSGVAINSTNFKVAVNAIICDTPARAFIKCKYHKSIQLRYFIKVN